MMYTEVNGKKCRNGILYTLLIWILSMFFCLTALFAIGDDPDLPLTMRMVRPYVATIAKLTGWDYFENLSQKISNRAWICQALRMKGRLVSYKGSLDSYKSFATLENVRCYLKHKDSIDQANANYDKAVKVLEAWQNGDTTPSSIVHNTVEQIKNLVGELAQARAGGSGNTPKIKFNAETLAMILLQSGACFEYKVDSVGADTEKYSKDSTVFINGYMKFNPEAYRNNFVQYIKPFNFSEVRHGHDLAIYLLEKDDGSGITFWGQKSQFDFETLWGMLGFKKNGDATNGMFAGITLARGKKMFISCDRLSWTSGDDFDTIMINLRPQGWCKWSASLKSVEEEFFNELKITSTHEVVAPSYYEKIVPATVTSGKHTAVKHVFFDKASGIAPDAVVEPIISTLQVFINKKKAENNGNKIVLSDKNSPVVNHIIMQRALTPEEKAVTAQAKIEEGKKVEETGDYPGAYKLYKQAADLDSDKGRLNCAIMLVQNSVTYNDRNGFNISFEIARQFAAETLEKSKDKQYRGIACNILGVLYNTGGRGLDRNVSLAIKYFEQGAALGDENAIKNFREMRGDKAPVEVPKATPKASPKATPKAAPVAKPEVKKTVMTPEEKAAAAQAKIAEGYKLDVKKDYVGAYRLYKQAADLGSDKGRLNCAILLAQNKVTYNNDRGYDISYEVARQFSAEILEKSQDKKYRGEACNILGVLYNTGGKGIRRNVFQASRYFEQGAALGDEFAIKNLEDMRKSRRR